MSIEQVRDTPARVYTFTKHPTEAGHDCLSLGDHAGEYVSLADYHTLEAAAAALRAERDAARQEVIKRGIDLVQQRVTISRLDNEIDTLTARLARVTEACEPFRLFAETWDDNEYTQARRTEDKWALSYARRGFTSKPDVFINMGHIRELRAALAAPGQGVKANTGCRYCDDHDLRLKLVSGTGKFLGWYHDVDGVAQRCTAALAAPVDAPCKCEHPKAQHDELFCLVKDCDCMGYAAADAGGSEMTK